ncbi:WbqC family protein [Geofilum rubicundum]|uniref:WbqC family protein n=1 Tax=Geofilum rubicundum TaxID=472113 RepID=UPI00078096D3|nr:WbqC family protein [Geofilum rubicundum]
MKKIFSSALFAPVHYFAHLAACSQAVIELHCHYSRQSYRNRYVIYGANGPMPLTVPVVKESGKKTATKEVRVSYDTPWNEVHWKSIEAAYNSSPYYLYYKDDIEPLFTKKWDLLSDLNAEALRITMECTGVDTPITYSREYHSGNTEMLDLREVIHPKKDFHTDKQFLPRQYRQVFGIEKPFVPNLSILDLIFNKGPESLLVLRDSLTVINHNGRPI